MIRRIFSARFYSKSSILHSHAAKASTAHSHHRSSPTPSPSPSPSPPLPKSNYAIREPALSHTIILDKPFPLTRTSELLPSLRITYSRIGNLSGPIVYIMPSMSHSCNVASDDSGWWRELVGYGSHYGVDLHRFQVISASPLGGPFGSTSPLTINPVTGKPYKAAFPVITPADQANMHARLLDALGIDSVFAVVGASMGGMQALQFALQYPKRFSRLVALCTTTRSSPSTVALRAVQRLAVQLDPKYNGGDYDPLDGPVAGMKIARSMGTICYRSREEFDSRFRWRADEETHRFQVESYLDHVSNAFSYHYDPNCYLSLSRCMDLMDFTWSFHGGKYSTAIKQLNPYGEYLLLPVYEDNLIPYHELNEFSMELGNHSIRNHTEILHSPYGHDYFLKEYSMISPRIAAFLMNDNKDDGNGNSNGNGPMSSNNPHGNGGGVENVRKYIGSIEKE